MMVVEATVSIDRPADVILDWVGNLDRYRRADRKIVEVVLQEPGRVRYRGRLRGLPTPVDEQTVHRDAGRSLVFRGAPHWTRALVDFEGGFFCSTSGAGTMVVHRESYRFKPAPIRWVAEWWLRSWLQRDIEDEVGRLKELVETET